MKSDISYGGAVLTLGYTHTAREADMQSPWSGYPGYTSVQVQDFNRAGENAFMVKGSYDFTRLGLEGVTAYALFVHGWDRVDPIHQAHRCRTRMSSTPTSSGGLSGNFSKVSGSGVDMPMFISMKGPRTRSTTFA